MDTLTIVGISTVIILIVYYYFAYKNFINGWNSRNARGPPNPCPDTFRHEGNNMCRNVQNIGSCPKGPDGTLELNGTVSFNDKKYKGPNGPLEKCKWAKSCKTPWEGIDNLCV